MKPHPPGAIASLVLGIFSILTGGVPVCGIILGALAVFQARRATNSQQQYGDLYQPTGIHVAGLVTGIIGMVMSILATLWMFFFFGLVGMIVAAATHIEKLPTEPVLLW